MGPLVTVFTPAYNHARYLGEYFDSLLTQTYDNVELIIFDDGSTDETWAIIEDHRNLLNAKFPHVILERHENIGAEEETIQAHARARGELICTLESDDYYLPRKLEKNVEYLERHPEIGVVHSDTDWVIGDRIERAHWKATARRIPTGDVFEGLLVDNFVLFGSACCRTDVLRRSVDVAGYLARGYAAIDYAMCLDLASR